MRTSAFAPATVANLAAGFDLLGAAAVNAQIDRIAKLRADGMKSRVETMMQARALLTPEEYATYLLRSSSTADNLRSSLQLFQPTEDEFRRIFALQYAFDQQFNATGGVISPPSGPTITSSDPFLVAASNEAPVEVSQARTVKVTVCPRAVPGITTVPRTKIPS